MCECVGVRKCVGVRDVRARVRMYECTRARPLVIIRYYFLFKAGVIIIKFVFTFFFFFCNLNKHKT